MIKEIIAHFDDKYLSGRIRHIYYYIIGCNAAKTSSNELYGNQFEDFVYDPSEKKQLLHVDPKGIVTSKRLDIIVRYLLFREMIRGDVSKETESLYSRTILTRTGAIEPKDFYSTNEKNGIDSHLEAAKNLLEDMKANGFNEQYYIPIAKNLGLYNGAHRMAAAMALNEKAWIRYVGKNGVNDFNFEWFTDNGFSKNDLISILGGFADVHSDCGIYILYGSCIDEWNYIHKQINKRFHIVGSIELDFQSDYKAFENLIHDIYMDYDCNSAIQRKIQLLKLAKLVLRVILVSDEDFEWTNFYEELATAKKEIRRKLSSKYPENAYITFHGSDSKEEFGHLKDVLLSTNNLKSLHMRTRSEYRREFLEWIESYKDYCYKHNIDINDTCIVGSSPLEVIGIRNSTDIDIVITSELRKIYGEGIVHLTSDLDIATHNYVKNEKTGEVYLKDDDLIHDSRRYFIFNGCKFANVDLVRKRKNSSDREKDINDVKLIDLYNDCYKYFDEKKVLYEQIKKELEIRKK